MSLPIDKAERPVIWNAKDRVIKWNNKTKNMEAYNLKKSPLLEKFDTAMGRLRIEVLVIESYGIIGQFVASEFVVFVKVIQNFQI